MEFDMEGWGLNGALELTDAGTVSLSLLLFIEELLLLLDCCCFSLSRFPKKKLAKDIVDDELEGDLAKSFGDSGEVTKGKVGSVFKNHAPDFFHISRLSEQILQKYTVVPV
jgi:hypothetical protein